MRAAFQQGGQFLWHAQGQQPQRTQASSFSCAAIIETFWSCGSCLK